MSELPMDTDAERAVLGAIIRDPQSFARISAIAGFEDFFDPKHKRIWAAIEHQWQAGGLIDPVTIASRLADANTIDLVGWDYLLHLDDGLGAIFGGDEYARRVKDKAILRRTIAACESLILECQQEGDSREVLDRGERVLRDLTAETRRDRRLLDAGEIIRESGGLDGFLAGTRAAVPLPWRQANDILAGGFRNGELIVLAAATSVGKTATASQIADYAASQGVGTALFTLEMHRRDMLMRMAVMRSGVDGNCVRTNRLTPDQRRQYQTALLELTRIPVYFDDQAGSTVPALHAAIRHKRATHVIGLIVVDYIQLVQGATRKSSTREQEVSSVSRGLKLMATEFDVPVVALSQINREGEGREEPEIRDLRESGGIGNDANTIMFLHRRDPKAMYQDVIPVRLLVKKQRNGPLGYVDLLYHKRQLRFWEEEARAMAV